VKQDKKRQTQLLHYFSTSDDENNHHRGDMSSSIGIGFRAYKSEPQIIPGYDLI